jgi:hypothetical protein
METILSFHFFQKIYLTFKMVQVAALLVKDCKSDHSFNTRNGKKNPNRLTTDQPNK